ncbi:MAG TPA: hypothetical protein PKE45_13025, partial [Caldilineaceae bacterium]|nr:hypothetical protein [Caldilineaceae bacterium]
IPTPTETPVAEEAASQAAQGPVRAQNVQGTLPGGQFAKFWLGLGPTFANANVTVIAEWDRPDPGSSGVGFYILDASGIARTGEAPL